MYEGNPEGEIVSIPLFYHSRSLALCSVVLTFLFPPPIPHWQGTGRLGDRIGDPVEIQRCPLHVWGDHNPRSSRCAVLWAALNCA